MEERRIRRLEDVSRWPSRLALPELQLMLEEWGVSLKQLEGISAHDSGQRQGETAESSIVLHMMLSCLEADGAKSVAHAEAATALAQTLPASEIKALLTLALELHMVWVHRP